ncbi:hypothetical protein BASA50_000891 [Batrachochytrium salamandrivorans]|uniref:Small ribosomal subunit protein mS35 mitochondrial conserved domain-containing protein n=1 Tax=Batrachochytrium salamandrivorans TaxID=1357716 RepID=A0ABQ8ESL8_9FUNG|nr:hypothetical protein BASA62_006597 [Batrachochytrium salamandrivorans]KAH6576360.1 hypothetical protein BASA60_004560 [Batrachochytrium salamandrivorans]KAH6585948.1 hypothetical protein BASA50_000891 [Batrachochytrium salamandrivorans]KAH9265607.1 hypothetical protein BASA84_001503 [Batrachochytrium salamandrivorans]KAH9275766.1 hypothetical protein BASA83_001568 [Batrachochytrium salamandrivorans]
MHLVIRPSYQRAQCAAAACSLSVRATGIMGCLPSRPLSSSAICAARKSPGATSTAQKGLPSIPLTGNLDVDGLHRFEIDLMETADWVKAALIKMKHARKNLSALHKPFEPSSPAKPLCVQYTERYTYDFTRPPPINNAIQLQVRVADLGLTSQERHRFLLLAGTTYDPYLDVVSMRSEKGQQDSLSEKIDRTLSLKELSGRIDKMIAAAKTLHDSFTDVPVNLSHAKRPKGVQQSTRSLKFPAEWLKPTAPATQKN